MDGLPSGYSVGAASPHSALDYVRAPFFDRASGTALPASGSASADDLQDLMSLHLQHCKDAGGEIFAFGDRFDSNRHLPIDAQFGNTDGLHGIHNIHLNQGNTGRHASENGPFQDGGVILAHPDWHLLSDPTVDFVDLGPDFYDIRAGTQRAIRNHVRHPEALGYTVTLHPAA